MYQVETLPCLNLNMEIPRYCLPQQSHLISGEKSCSVASTLEYRRAQRHVLFQFCHCIFHLWQQQAPALCSFSSHQNLRQQSACCKTIPLWSDISNEKLLPASTK